MHVHGSSRTQKARKEICGRYNPVREAARADFIYKLGNAIEEADESALWLEILTEAEISASSETDPLWREADELVRILVRSRETARANR